MTMRGKTRTILREHPISQGTQNLIGLVSSTSSPVSPVVGKFDSTADRQGTNVSVEEKERDLERGD